MHSLMQKKVCHEIKPHTMGPPTLYNEKFPMLGGPIIQGPLILYWKQGLYKPRPQAPPLGVGFLCP